MKNAQRILIVDDEDKFRTVIAQKLLRRGYEVFESGTFADTLFLLKETLLDLVLLDLNLPDGDGLTLLPQIKELQPDIQVVMLTGQGTLESAIEAMKRGAYDFLTKPCSSSKMEVTIQKALEKKNLIIENAGLRLAVARQSPELTIIAKSHSMLSLLEITKKVAQSDAPILILGESGVGKELIARAIHLWSSRVNSSYITLNSGAIPETLMESELFGYEKGAFTGATVQKIGLVEMAHQGTLFLDEIGDMPLSLQVKLLRFLETGEFRRVGDTKLRRVSVRLITATNRNLNDQIKQEKFREDLYYRINGFTLEIPPLRTRKEDILPLADYFLKKSAPHSCTSQPYILDEECKESLLNYNFPGNVRELSHIIKRGQLLSTDGIIKTYAIWPEQSYLFRQTSPENSLDLAHNSHLPEDIFIPFSHLKDKDYPTLDEVERRFILATLKRLNGNRTQTAKLLGISVRNLYRKLEAYEAESPTSI
jgi:two-component system, NtrC family, response regulator AtoC